MVGLAIEDCPQLEYLSAYHNKIKEIDLTGLTKLKEVNLNSNLLENISLGIIILLIKFLQKRFKQMLMVN